MYLKALGINHKSAPIAVREKLAFSTETANLAIKDLKNYSGVNELVLISTCNRTELYLEGNSAKPVLRWLQDNSQLPLAEIKPHSYFLTNQAVVRHLMRVASGLDSMVLGEVQILGQLKTAYNQALEVGSLGKFLSRLFQNAFAVAKEVRTNTQISVNPISIAYIAVRLAKQIFADLSKRNIMVIGSGDTAKLILQHLCSSGANNLLLANRTLERAKLVAKGLPVNCKIQCLDLESIPDYLPQADIVISSTASPLPLLGKGLMERVIKQRRHRPIFMVDVAVPRDIEPEVGQLADVYLYCIDDLQAIAEKNQQTRQVAVEQAEVIIAKQAESFMQWLQAQNSIGTICEFREACQVKTEQSLAEAIRQLKAGVCPEEVVHRLARVLHNRLLHEPTVSMRRAGFAGDDQILDLIRSLYKL